jgi:hypothetical protein
MGTDIESNNLYEIRENNPEGKYLTVLLKTDRGKVECRYYPVEGAKLGTIWVGGVGGDFDTPSDNLYPSLCEKLKSNNIASLRVQFRHPQNIDEAAFDILAGVSFLETLGIKKIGFIGHSLGGAAVIQAATETILAKTVITLATQSSQIDLPRQQRLFDLLDE